jgi:import inner membrane translocase subunit TIM21
MVFMNSIVTARSLLRFPADIHPLLAARLYATQTGLGTTAAPRARRKAVTTFNDDGRVAWGDLTAREKAARTTQQTFNFSFIILGAVLTVWSSDEMLKI